ALHSIFGRAVEVLVLDAVLFERATDDGEHGDELREDEHPVAALVRLAHELAQRGELAAVVVLELARQVQQARIARDLTKPREAREDLDVRLGEADAIDLAEHGLPD